MPQDEKKRGRTTSPMELANSRGERGLFVFRKREDRTLSKKIGKCSRKNLEE